MKCKAEGGEVESLYEVVFHGGAEWWMDMAVALGALAKFIGRNRKKPIQAEYVGDEMMT